MGLPITMILLYFLLLGHAAADSGDDFSNNLFTDLSPLLALFGERVTMQFISQAMGLSDCIILAMAPLGIITIIVAAIRVGGPSWLKALIGRATENLAAAELELMSSTSNEVCELWNGNDVVRCAGSAPVWEFICLLPNQGVPKNPEIKIMSLEEALTGQTGGAPCMEEMKVNINLWNKLRGKQIQQTEDGHVQPDTQSTNPSSDEPNVIIIRNTRHAAPNISHNRYKNTGRGELYFAACFGVLLQIGVILYCGIITQFPRRASKFQKDGSPVGSYAFPLTTIGTVVLNIGMLICCRVVETRTKENAYRPTKKWRARMVWLQRETTVGDQEFKSFALYTGEDQPIVITSERKDPSGKPNTVNTAEPQQHNGKTNQQTRSSQDNQTRSSQDNQTRSSQDNQTQGSKDNTGEIDCQKTSLGLMTVLGTTISLVGFFAQFIGIRGMHWSASVASLVAILMMTAVRAWVRRGLAKPMYSKLLRPGFELDWFADTLKDISGAPWYNTGKRKGMGGSPPTEPDEGAVPDPQDTTMQNSNINEAQQCIERRRKLAKLAGCEGPVSKEAIAVTLAIEATMNLLDKKLKRNNFSWDYNIEGSSITNPAKFQLDVKKREENKWKANAGEIEAALSLRLFYDKSQQEALSLANVIHKSDNPSNDDTWLRLKGEVPDMGIRILGPKSTRLLRHLEWWVPEDGPQIWTGQAGYVPPNDAGNHVNAIGNISAGCTKFEIDESRVVGLDPRTLRSTTSSSSSTVMSEGDSISNESVAVVEESGTTANSHSQLSFPYYHKPQRGRWKFELPNEESKLSVYIKTLDPLKVLYAKDMFSAFMWAVVEILDGSIEDKTDVQTSQTILDKDECSWRRLVLRNDNISRYSLAIQSSGLCNIHEAYISVILPLCMQQKLPEVDGIINLVQSQTRELEARHLWREAGDVYLQLRDHLAAFSVESYTYIRAIAALIAFRKALRNAEPRSDLAEQLMKSADVGLEQKMTSLFELQDVNIHIDIDSERQDLFCLAQEYKTLDKYDSFRDDEAKAKDIFDRTPLHYCAVFSHHPMFGPENENGAEIPLDEDIYNLYLKRIRRLIDNGTDINGCDIRGWTPLHYACHTGNASEHVARLLLEKGALVDVRGRDGTAPIHCAAIEGHFEIVKLLLKFGANIDILDGSGSTALHAAAFRGSAEIFQLLCSRSRITRDRQGRTAIHMAAMKGFTAAIEDWVGKRHYRGGDVKSKDQDVDSKDRDADSNEQDVDSQDRDVDSKDRDVDSKDYDEKTPLRYAVEFGHGEFVQKLLGLSQVDMDATAGEEKCTVLHIACEKGHDEIVGILLDAGAYIEAANIEDETPLLCAIRNQRQSTVKLLIARGAELATVLEVTARRGDTVVFEHLVSERRIDVKIGAGTWGGTLLHRASGGIDNNPMIEYLFIWGAEVDAIDGYHRTPLHRAVINDKPANIRLLVNLRANKEAKDWYGWTPLQLAAAPYYSDLAERQECIRLLIKLGALVNSSDDRGRTALHSIAVNEALADLIPELLEAGAEIEKVDRDGCTPLHLAALGECTEAIKALAEYGANTEAVDNDGETPRTIAEREGLSDWWRENIPPSMEWWRVSSVKLAA